MSNLVTLNAADKRIGQLAESMFELLAETGECTRDQLRMQGFSTHELDTFGDAARARANERFVRQASASGWGATERAAREREREGFTRTDDEWVRLAAGACLGAIGDAQTTTAMLGAGIPPHIIDRLWTRIMRKVGIGIGNFPAAKQAEVA